MFKVTGWYEKFMPIVEIVSDLTIIGCNQGAGGSM